MESYKLIQLLSQNPSNKYELHHKFKNIDVSASILDEILLPQSGYNCLHASVLMQDLKHTQQLLDRGADLLKQGTFDGNSPLLALVNEKLCYESKKVEVLCGKLGKNSMVDLLLNEQVKRNQAFNPKCFKGLSHLHIACMVNHLEAVIMFLKAGESVNLPVTSPASSFAGYTPLHMAVRYSSVNVAYLLLGNKADIHQKDAMGLSPLHKLIQRLILTADYITMGKSVPLSPLVRELENLEKIIALIFKTRKNKKLNFVDNLRLTSFHVACTLRDPSLAVFFLKQDVDVNISLTNNNHLWPGWSVLHFAACCNFNTVKLLIEDGADINIRNSEGITALDMCMRRYSPAVIHSILSTKEEYEQILLSDGSTKLLDLLLAMDDCDKFQSFLQNMPDANATIPFDSPIWPGYNILHLAISMHEKTEDAKGYIQKNLVLQSYLDQYYKSSEVEEKNYWRRIVVCLARQCSLVVKNAAGLTPIHLAFHLSKVNVVEKLLNCCLSSNEVDESRGLSFLHIACAVGKKNVVERFVDDINTPVGIGFRWFKDSGLLPIQADSTPLHIAAFFQQLEIVEFILQLKNVDVYAKDYLGFTPIHLSIISRPVSLSFFGKITNLREVISLYGLSHLHIAAFADNERAIEMLVKNNANINVVYPHRPRDMISGFFARNVYDTPLHVAVRMDNLKAVSALIQAGADIHMVGSRAKYETPLHLAIESKCDELMSLFAKKLRRDKRFNEPLEPCGVTLLHLACATFDLKWAKSLLEKGADPNAQIRMDKDYVSDWKGFTALHVALTRASFVKFERLEDIVRLLIRHGSDVTLQNNDGHSPVLLAEKIANKPIDKEEKCEFLAFRMLSMADLLLKSQQSFDINPATRGEGLTHFHYACKRNHVNIVRKFLKNGVDVNHAKRAGWEIDGGFTPLHFAISSGCWDVAWLLLEHNADVMVRDIHGNSALHLTVIHLDDVRLLEKIYSLGADIKAKDYEGSTPFDILLHSGCISYETLKFFLDHGYSLEMDIESDVNMIGLLMSSAKPFDRKNIFLLIFESYDLIEKIKNGFNAIQSLVGFTPESEWPEHRRWTVDMFLEAIQFFIDIGCDINQQNMLGTTALHEAATYFNVKAFEALLLLGARIDLCEYRNGSPFDFVVQDTYYLSSSSELTRLKKHSANYVWKMKFVGLDIVNLDEEIVESVWKYLDLKIKERCEDELKRMAKTKVGEKWTLKDFLSETKAVIEYQMLSLEKRRSVDEFFKCHADLRKNFPEFCGLLMSQYRMAVKNVEYYWLMKNAVATLLKLELPEECFKMLLENIKITMNKSDGLDVEDSSEEDSDLLSSCSEPSSYYSTSYSE